jgi:2-oxoglutarate dehydrogenase E1 component
VRAETFEQYLRKVFPGQKSFSLEGLDSLVPLLDELAGQAAATGIAALELGMAHRGRLNVLAHLVGVSYGELLREFESERALAAVAQTDLEKDGMGDVKYHLGANGRLQTPHGQIEIRLASNPSHLEAVNAVVEGMTRARQSAHTRAGEPVRDERQALAVLVHGDAAFPGQDSVAEVLNPQQLSGAIHLIANNQVGFTTDPADRRSTRHASDLAKGFDCPIVHVNADDPEAVLAAARLALAFHERFRHDVVIDLIGYRRLGHNEPDEPAYTQPRASAQIAAHPTVAASYCDTLISEGALDEHEYVALRAVVDAELRAAHEALRAEIAVSEESTRNEDEEVSTLATLPTPAPAVSASLIRQLNEDLMHVPPGITVHPKLAGQLARREHAIEEGGIDYGQAEALAFASLLADGVPIRLTGQDVERGTFSQRHLVLHDAETGARQAPIQHLPQARASFEVRNSPLSEYAALGFEYGYAVATPEALVLWEAQFGDFANGAQIIIDQFIASGFSKWGESSRLTLLLPHGYEGSGPEHSNARIERFLQLAFRASVASSTLDELATGSFQPVLGDAEAAPFASSVIACSGRVYYDLDERRRAHGHDDVPIVRVEQLYPFPLDELRETLAGYPSLAELVWVQEEPQNLGPGHSIRHQLEATPPAGVELRYAGRPRRSSPSEGYSTLHGGSKRDCSTPPSAEPGKVDWPAVQKRQPEQERFFPIWKSGRLLNGGNGPAVVHGGARTLD